MENEFDSEVSDFVSRLNALNADKARLILNPNEHFRKAQLNFKPMLGAIDWEQADLIASSAECIGETAENASLRVQIQFGEFTRSCHIAANDRVLLLSDGLYELGIECSACVAASVLDTWCDLPHAVFVFTTDYRACFHVSFNRSIYLGRAHA